MTRPTRLVVALGLTVLCSGSVPAQETPYRDKVFPTTTVTADINYGAAFNRYSRRIESLALDLYQPDGELFGLRPAVVLVHGGAFNSGSRTRAGIVSIAEDFASRGYVAVSIDYRKRPSGTFVPQDVTDAAHDVKAAVRWLRRSAASLFLDPTRIACVGSSAGAVACLEAAYVAGEGVSGNPGFSSSMQAVVDLWGYLQNESEIDPGEAPLCIIHGTNDEAVPFARANALGQAAAAAGVPHRLHLMQGLGHAPFTNYLANHHDVTVACLYEFLNLGQLSGLGATENLRNVTIETFGIPGDLWWVLASTDTGNAPLPGLGVLCLDPTSLVMLPGGVLPANAELPTAGLSLGLPRGAIGGLAFQVLHTSPALEPRLLTNCVRIR